MDTPTVTPPSRWNFVNVLPSNEINVQRALVAYTLSVIAAFFGLFLGLKVRPWSSLIVSLIVGQVVLNVIFLPTRLDFWAEFDSFVAIYGLVQLLTPILVFVYAIVVAVHDKRGRTCAFM